MLDCHIPGLRKWCIPDAHNAHSANLSAVGENVSA
jgi:hypothetical protein